MVTSLQTLSTQILSRLQKYGTITTFAQILAASLFIALSAHIQIPLYFTPVPLTGQTFAVMLIGAILGSRKGALSVLLYLLEGFAGLPVFAGGGMGILTLMGPKGGYLIGWILQAYLAGFLFNSEASKIKTIAILLFSVAVQLSMGALWLIPFVGLEHVMLMGIYPFVFGEVLKVLAVTAYLRSR